jgi:hypothetical protein
MGRFLFFQAFVAARLMKPFAVPTFFNFYFPRFQ